MIEIDGAVYAGAGELAWLLGVSASRASSLIAASGTASVRAPGGGNARLYHFGAIVAATRLDTKWRRLPPDPHNEHAEPYRRSERQSAQSQRPRLETVRRKEPEPDLHLDPLVVAMAEARRAEKRRGDPARRTDVPRRSFEDDEEEMIEEFIRRKGRDAIRVPATPIDAPLRPSPDAPRRRGRTPKRQKGCGAMLEPEAVRRRWLARDSA